MSPPEPHQNHLLASLPEAALLRWLPQLELVHLTLGQVLYEPGATMTHAYFPTTCIVSMLYVMKNGELFEGATLNRVLPTAKALPALWWWNDRPDGAVQ